ncbi:hypothetical protein ES703_75157 [subsurface metagenome]
MAFAVNSGPGLLSVAATELDIEILGNLYRAKADAELTRQIMLRIAECQFVTERRL